jgi:hypothetical protein
MGGSFLGADPLTLLVAHALTVEGQSSEGHVGEVPGLYVSQRSKSDCCVGICDQHTVQSKQLSCTLQLERGRVQR